MNVQTDGHRWPTDTANAGAWITRSKLVLVGVRDEQFVSVPENLHIGSDLVQRITEAFEILQDSMSRTRRHDPGSSAVLIEDSDSSSA